MSQPLPGDWEDGQSSSRPHSNTKQVSLAIPLVDQSLPQLPIGCSFLLQASHWLLNDSAFFLSQSSLWVWEGGQSSPWPHSNTKQVSLAPLLVDPSYSSFLLAARFYRQLLIGCSISVLSSCHNLYLESTTLHYKTGFTSHPIGWSVTSQLPIGCSFFCKLLIGCSIILPSSCHNLHSEIEKVVRAHLDHTPTQNRFL